MGSLPSIARRCAQIVLPVMALLSPAGADPGAAETATPPRPRHYISPAGSDANTGTSAQNPWRSFRHAFASMAGGDELVLLDGEYSDASGTGRIDYVDREAAGPNSAQIPSGLPSAPTRVRAENPGRAVIRGRLFVGRSFRKDRHIEIDGITFHGRSELFNTTRVTIRNCGFRGGLGIGTNDHEQGNDHNLIEDVWVWGTGQRGIAVNYRASYNVWRRVLVRGDGCGTAECSEQPNVGITVYDSNHVSLQNVMVVDRVLARGDQPYGDFAAAQHTPGAHLFGHNEWLGTISLKAPDTGYYLEPDRGGTIDPTFRIANAIAWDSAQAAFNITRSGNENVFENLTARSLGGDGVRLASDLGSGVLRNVLVAGAARYGINSRYPPAYVAVTARGDALNQERCATDCFLQHDARADGAVPSLRYLVRIESRSFLKGRGMRGADIGANVVYRYGREGTSYGQPGYNMLTTARLWPWPNEARIKREMCEESGVSRGFCAAPSLTRYVWEFLGHPMPGDPGPTP